MVFPASPFRVVVFFILSLAASAAVNLPVPPITGLGQDHSSLSVPLVLQSGPDSHFKIRGTFGDKSLDIITLLMNAVSGLADLAHQPFRKRITGFHVTTLPQYPKVDISIQSITLGDDIEVRIAVDGLYYLISNMIKIKSFRNANFDILWDNRAIARILISEGTAPSATLTGTNDPTQSVAMADNQPQKNDTGAISVSLAADAGPLTAGVQAHFDYFPNGETLTSQEVFITIMATLRNLAKWPSNDIVEPFRSGAAGFNARMQFLAEETPRTKPPFLRYGYLINTVKQIPGYMLQHKRFAELGIIVAYEAEVIGRALLEKGSPELGDVGNAAPVDATQIA